MYAAKVMLRSTTCLNFLKYEMRLNTKRLNKGHSYLPHVLVMNPYTLLRLEALFGSGRSAYFY